MTRASRQGSITVFFVLLSFIALGAVSYSLYISRVVQEKMRLTTAADLAALSMANHTASGLNMLAINNLGIASNLHVGGAVPFFGRYYAFIQALAITAAPKGLYDQARLESLIWADDSVFGEGFDWTKELSAVFIQGAAGMTKLSDILVDTWFLQTMPRGLEMARINAPGTLAFPLELLGAGSGPSEIFKVKHLWRSKVRDTMCHTIHASNEALGDDRQSMTFWFRGFTNSIASGVGDILAPLQVIEQLMQKMISGALALFKGAKAILDAAIIGKVGQIGCDVIGFVPGLDELCDAVDAIYKMDELGGLPIPRFTECGLNQGGQYAEQMEVFEDQESHKDEIGFTYPNTKNDTQLKEFEESIRHSLVLAKPLFLKEELPKSPNGKGTKCPEGWSNTGKDGKTFCEVPLDGGDWGTASKRTTTSDLDSASGGVSSATGTAGNAKLRSLLSRTQWVLSEAKAEYHPIKRIAQNDAVENDPFTAQTYTLNPATQMGAIVKNTRFQLFWPAWKGRFAPVTSMDKMLDFFGSN